MKFRANVLVCYFAYYGERNTFGSQKQFCYFAGWYGKPVSSLPVKYCFVYKFFCHLLLLRYFFFFFSVFCFVCCFLSVIFPVCVENQFPVFLSSILFVYHFFCHMFLLCDFLFFFSVFRFVCCFLSVIFPVGMEN